MDTIQVFVNLNLKLGLSLPINLVESIMYIIMENESPRPRCWDVYFIVNQSYNIIVSAYNTLYIFVYLPFLFSKHSSLYHEPRLVG